MTDPALTLTVLGSATPYPTADNPCSGYLLTHGRTRVWVDAGSGTLGGHNFAVLFPVWDVLFRTANFELRYDPTGIRDQLPEAGGRDYGRGFWAQQRLGLLRMFGRG